MTGNPSATRPRILVLHRVTVAVALGLATFAVPSAGHAGFVTLAATGRAAPGGGTFGTNFGVPVINAAGQVAFTVQTNPGFPNATDVGVYQGTSSSDLAAVLRVGGATTSVGRNVAENAAGIVVFSANDNTQIVSHDGSGVHVIANAGDPYQPVANGTTFTLGSVSDPVINDQAPAKIAYNVNDQVLVVGDAIAAYAGKGDLQNGQVAAIYASTLDALGDTVFFTLESLQDGDHLAIATTNFANDIVDFVLQGGDAVAGGATLALDVSSSVATSVPMIGNGGFLFKSAACAGFDCGGGIFFVQGSGPATITTVVKSGDAAPGGGTFSSAVSVLGSDNNYLVFDEPQINDKGSFVFVGATDGGPGSGVYRWTQAHGLEAMALQGHAPYAAAAGFRNAVINSNDVVAFQAFDGSAPTGRSVYVTDGVNTVRAGSDNFFGAEGSSTGAFSRTFFGSPTEGLSPLNDRAEVTFVTGDAVHGEAVVKVSVDPKWVQPGSGSWDVASNWVFGVAPGADSNVTIPGQAAGPLVVTGPAAPATLNSLILGIGPHTATLDLQSAGPLTCKTNFVVDTNGVLGGIGTLTAHEFDVSSVANAPGGTVTGTLTLNATVFNGGTMDGDLTFNGPVTNEETGVIKGNPTFNGDVVNMGTISPGHSPGTVTVNGNLTLQALSDQGALGGSDLAIEIGGSNPGTDYDVIHVTGHAALAGRLHVTFINGFTPSPGQTFHVLDAASVSGSFDLVTGAVVTSLQGGLEIAAPDAVTVTSTPKALVGCSSAITKAGSSYTTARLKALDACVGGVFKCVEETAAGAKRDACIAKSGAACGKDLTKIDGLVTKLTGAIDKACAPVGAADMLAAIGGGYVNVSADCQSDFSTTLDTLASIEQCALRGHDCRGDAILNAQAPRAKELMRVAGVASGALDTLACLPDDMGTGADLGAPNGAGKAVASCEATIIKAGDAFASKVEKSLTSCVGAVYACVTEKPTDATCVTKAQAGCDKDFAAIDAAGLTFQGALEKSCASPPLGGTDLTDPAGANAQALNAACIALGIGGVTSVFQYAPCLVDLETCAVEDLVRLEAPRAGEMLALVGHQLKSARCP